MFKSGKPDCAGTLQHLRAERSWSDGQLQLIGSTGGSPDTEQASLRRLKDFRGTFKAKRLLQTDNMINMLDDLWCLCWKLSKLRKCAVCGGQRAGPHLSQKSMNRSRAKFDGGKLCPRSLSGVTGFKFQVPIKLGIVRLAAIELNAAKPMYLGPALLLV